MNVACCPYCKGDRFTNEVIRADAPNPSAPTLHGLVYGHWFNQCSDCGKWSIHKDGVQLKVGDGEGRPMEHSSAPIE